MSKQDPDMSTMDPTNLVSPLTTPQPNLQEPALNGDVPSGPTSAPAYTVDDEKRVLRKIDLWILPALSLLYLVQQLCKGSLARASAFDLSASFLSSSSLCTQSDVSSSSFRDGPRGLTVQLDIIPALHRATSLSAPLIIRPRPILNQTLGPTMSLWL
jgi:hypothetical protein